MRGSLPFFYRKMMSDESFFITHHSYSQKIIVLIHDWEWQKSMETVCLHAFCYGLYFWVWGVGYSQIIR